MHCVGLANCDATTPLLVLCAPQPKKPLQLLLCVLDEWSSALLSPFYEHEVRLAEQQPQGGEERTECTELSSAIVYTLHDWSAARFRVPASVTNDSQYAEQCRDVLRDSFWLLLDPAGGNNNIQVAAWHRRCLDWRCYTTKGLATQYRRDFSLGEWLAREATPAQYWKEFRARFSKQWLTPALAASGLQSKEAVPHDLRHLDTQLERWREGAHLRGYLQYRLQDMALHFRVARRRVLQAPLAALGLDRLQDLDTALRALTEDEEEGQAVPKYNNLEALLRTTVKPGQLAPMLREHFAQVPARRVMSALLGPHFVAEQERRAQDTPSTCWPITTTTLLAYWRRLMPDCETGGADVRLDEPSSNDDECEPTVSALAGWLWHRAPLSPAWRRVHSSAPLLPSSPLWVLECKPSVQEAERELRALLGEGAAVPLQCEVLENEAACAWDAGAAAREYRALDPVVRSLYRLHCRALLYKPGDLAPHGGDALAAVLRDDTCEACAVLWPPGCDSARRRVRAHFARRDTEPTLRQLDPRLWEAGSPGARPMPLVVALDCHLYSTEQLLALFQWLLEGPPEQPGRPARLLMMGAWDTLPLHCDGAAWWDALHWLQPQWTPKLFCAPQYNAALDEALKQAEARGQLLMCTDPLARLQTQLVTLLRERRPRPALVRLYAVTMPGAPESAGRALLGLMEEALTVKWRRNNCVTLELVPLARLALLPLSRAEDQQGAAAYFCARQQDLARLDRNALQLLLLGLVRAPLLVLATEAGGGGSPFKWLRRAVPSHPPPERPNSRFTLSYLVRQRLEATR